MNGNIGDQVAKKQKLISTWEEVNVRSVLGPHTDHSHPEPLQYPPSHQDPHAGNNEDIHMEAIQKTIRVPAR